MKKLQLLLALAGSFSLSAQITENRTVTPFSVLELKGTARVEITSFDSLFCTVTGESADLKNITLTQEDGKLIIRTNGMIKDDYKIKLGCKGLKSVSTDEIAVVESSVLYKTDNLFFGADGTSSIRMVVDAKLVRVKTDGVSNVRLKGNCDSLSVKADGISKVKAVGLISKSANVSADGQSKIYVNVTENLRASADGMSKIYYDGKPAESKLNIDGLSKIQKYEGDDENRNNNNNWNWSWNYDGGFKHWMGIGLLMNGYTDKNLSTSLDSTANYLDVNYGKSIGWDLNLIEHDFHLVKNYLNLCTGIGFQFNRYNFKNRITLDPDSSYVTASTAPTINYSKNVLKVSYVNIPLFLEVNTSKSPSKSFHIGAGAIAGIKLGSKTKQHFEIDGNNHSINRKDDYNLNPFKLQAMASIGYSWFTLYGTYNLTPLFEKGKGPELYPFTVGLRIIPFDGE
jgi:hypothetical protein